MDASVVLKKNAVAGKGLAVERGGGAGFGNVETVGGAVIAIGDVNGIPCFGKDGAKVENAAFLVEPKQFVR